MNNKQLRERIQRLEHALMMADRPYIDRTCECCKQLYIGYSIRCQSCCTTCYYSTDERQWIHGHLCPAIKRKNHE